MHIIRRQNDMQPLPYLYQYWRKPNKRDFPGDQPYFKKHFTIYIGANYRLTELIAFILAYTCHAARSGIQNMIIWHCGQFLRRPIEPDRVEELCGSITQDK